MPYTTCTYVLHLVDGGISKRKFVSGLGGGGSPKQSASPVCTTGFPVRVPYVARAAGVDCQFGDAKACTSKNLGGVPDIVYMTEDGEARIVGDLKTPWAHDLKSAMANPDKRRTWLGLLTPRYTWKIEN